MVRKISRRQVLVGASLLLPVAGGMSANASSEVKFAHGVASGDPDSTSVVIWTRVSQFDKPVAVNWLVSTDRTFKVIVDKGTYQTAIHRDYTVKVIVGNLKAGQTYYYKFIAEGTSSCIGRTKTLPVGHVEQLVLAVASCSNFSFGYFNAYEAIAQDESVDVVVHLGDYIYEHGVDGYGGKVGKRLGRNHDPRYETVSLKDYRIRHGQYKADECSQMMHAQHPLIVIWDDHESTNNPWMQGAQSHQAAEGEWLERREASLKAYFEWMPIRDPAEGVALEEYWRHYKFGDLISLITLESRHTGRSKQISYQDHLEKILTEKNVETFLKTVLGEDKREMLSEQMKGFLASELAESVSAGRTWRIIGNQTVMAKSVVPDISAPIFDGVFSKLLSKLTGYSLRLLRGLLRLGKLGLPSNLDAWDGYPVAREGFYKIAKEAGVRDLLVLSGDSHSYWANALFDNEDQAMGLELGTTGISSPGSLLSFGKERHKQFDDANVARNKEIIWVDGRHVGYIRLVVSHEVAHADFVTVSNVKSRKYEINIVHKLDIKNVNGILKYLS